MQSGISASATLQSAFTTLITTPTQRALLATISDETLIPDTTIPLTDPTNLSADLPALHALLTHHHATYILLKTHPDAAERDGYAAITYIPSGAPVREKMLFAATRLTLVRELGIERFRRTVSAQDKGDLEAGALLGEEEEEEMAGGGGVLTREEEGLRGVKDAEAKESMGTGARRGHVSVGVEVQVGEGVVEALSGLGVGGLVMLKYDLPGSERVVLAGREEGRGAGEVGGVISKEEPRYSFYGMEGEGGVRVAFIYTCPSGSRIKERMLYSTGKSWVRTMAERDAGVTVAKSLEATEPSELTAEELGSDESKTEPGEDGSGAAAGAGGKGFARPKRPGRR